ncbi:transporter [Photobacterium sp. DNB23_23_1]|uniref:Transporter n=1 Tax=Photobacterium pectinilyticum TaxID=2906793 RepID=A0ABT1N4Y6_9GAMM|nr:transporter [Photobacterium sp. ZSDE20]MCQ1059187.1 transporter [Photobacterium sp. ZSDE20]MDD1824839.1 transporter [Photobacterium sp. ZSDE20]
MSIFNNKSCIALLALISGTVAAETEQATNSTEPNTKPKRVQTFGDLLDPDLPGVLTPKGSFVLDTSFSFTQNSSNRVSVVGYTVLPSLIVGLIEASDTDRTTLTFGLTGRYGITNRLEVEARIPWVYRYDSVSKRDTNTPAEGATTTTFDGSDIGDIEAAFKYQINMETAPYWIAGLRFKTTTGTSPYDVPASTEFGLEELPTGSGFPSIEPSLTMIMPMDPAVIYANLSYIWNIEDDVTTELDGSSTKSKIDLGDTIGISAGMGFAVNPKFSFSLGLSHRTILKSKINGSTPSDSKLLQLDSISMGANYAINPETTLNVGVSAGLTADAPDFQLTVRVPYTLR